MKDSRITMLLAGAAEVATGVGFLPHLVARQSAVKYSLPTKE